MLSMFYATALIIAAATYTAFALARVIRDNNKYQFALNYCQVRINHRH